MLSFPHLRAETLRDARSFVLHWDKIEALRNDLGVEDDVLLNPLHFLAAADGRRRSCSVACWQGANLIGLTYATEHYVRGIASGYAVGGDYAGRGLLLCRPEHEAAVVEASVRQLVAGGIHSLHFRMMPCSEAKIAIPGIRVQSLDSLIPGDRMSLPATFEDFLGTLGRHTRRNIRYYTRKTRAAGIEFVPTLTREEYQPGVDRLNRRGTFHADPLHLARDERFLTLHSRVQRLGLRASDGSWVAILCGFTQGRRFHLLTQLNDVRHESLSLSIVLRGHMVEHLIANGVNELQFMGGTSLSFGRFCPPQKYRSIFIDKNSGIVATVKHLSGKITELMEVVGTPVPSSVKLMCNGYLKKQSLLERTAAGPAAVAFRRKSPSSRS
jgi:Acetyltransferase (GNAT) domain